MTLHPPKSPRARALRRELATRDPRSVVAYEEPPPSASDARIPVAEVDIELGDSGSMPIWRAADVV